MMYILLSSIALQYLHKVFRNHAYLVYIPIDPVVSLGRSMKLCYEMKQCKEWS